MPIFLFEDEGKKLSKRRLTLPPYLMKHLQQQQKLFSDKQYHQLKGFKRLNNLLSGELSFSDAKRMDFDINHMMQSPKNIEYCMIGGDKLKNWLHDSLNSLRSSVKKVNKVPEVEKLTTDDAKPKGLTNTTKLNGLDITLESKSFNKLITKGFKK